MALVLGREDLPLTGSQGYRGSSEKELDSAGWAVSAGLSGCSPSHMFRLESGQSLVGGSWTDLAGSRHLQSQGSLGQPEESRQDGLILPDSHPTHTHCPKAEEPPLSSLELGARDVPRRGEKRCENRDGEAGQEQRTYVSGSGFGPICSVSGHTSWSPVSGPGSL